MSDVSFNESEEMANKHIMDFMKIVHEEWQLIGNHEELASAVHVLQGFIIQHMLSRIDSDKWGNWYGEEK